MATVIVFTQPGLGHVYPTLPILSELVRRGDRVIYYCGEETRAQIEATGTEFRPIPWDYSKVDKLPNPHLSDITLESLRCTEAWLPQLLKEVREAAPSYLLVDFLCPWGRYAARSLKLPLALIFSTFVLGPGVLPPAPIMAVFDVGLSLTRLQQVREIRHISERLAQRYGVERMRTQVGLVSLDGDIVLSTTARLFQPRAELYDERFHFVGPSFESRGGEHPQTLPPLDDRPIVYVSLGTVFNGDLEFFRRCARALSDGRYQVIMSVGRKADPAALGPLPPNVHAFNYVSQLELLPRAALFITHGGMNSTNEAVCHEVPLLVAPQAVDQFAIAGRIEALGIGRRLRKKHRSPEQLRQLIDSLMTDPKVRERCREVKKAFLDAGGPKRAADLLQSFGARARPAPAA